MGAEVRAFEEAFAARFGRAHAVMVSSGSSANLVGVAALCHRRERPLCRGDEVIVPAIAWATTYYPLQQYGLKLRFVDVELETLNIDAARLADAVTPRTRMVVGVSVLGNPAALDVMRAFCDERGLILFEDNCESMGARLNGRLCGSFGDLSTFSTFYSHQISTMEGGLLLTDEGELAQLARAIRNHGWARTSGDEGHFESYRFVVPGYNVRPLEITAAIGREQLKKLDAMLATRRRNAARFVARFTNDPRFIIQRENGESSWFSFTIILNPALDADRANVLNALGRAGIACRMITGGNFLRHEAIRFFDYDTVGDIVNADIAHDRGFFVGNHPRDLSAEIDAFHDVMDRSTRPVERASAVREP
jgi:CDP-6-deoxy-D-xylo-4-hexulose-3-dehydrase